MSVPDLLAFVQSLECDFGIERSMKLTSAGVNRDRYLLSVHKDDLGPDSAAAFHAMAEALGIPARRRGELVEHLAMADIVHFGHEGGSPPVRKTYVEFATRLRIAHADGARQAALVHLALKWRVGDTDGHVSRYRFDPGQQSPDALISALDRSGVGRSRPPARAAVESIIGLARAKAGDHPLMLLEVSEEASPRTSWDINLYPAEITGNQIADATRQLFSAYDLPERIVDDLQVRLADETIGHVSIGLDRDGQDFATLYFGVEARHGHG